MILHGNRMREEGHDDNKIITDLQAFIPTYLSYQDTPIPIGDFLYASQDASPEEITNMAACREAMVKLVRLPTVKHAALMPDACVAGLIPVGGVIATEGTIHPGMHSADICCSMAMSIFRRASDPKKLLDMAQKITHFGPISKGASQRFGAEPSIHVLEAMEGNRFLKDLIPVATSSFMTQGDGNHFAYVGHVKSTGDLALVTHHGSRVLGALLYKRGMQAAAKHTRIVAPKVDPKAAWLDIETDVGRDYWEALQIVRLWTRENHFALHNMIGHYIGNKIETQIWNEHNFVFRKSDGLFYHAKGATPSYDDFSEDDSGMTLIPMNMQEPILITRHARNDQALGFAPHGAGRNMSRTAFLKKGEPELPQGIDYRFFCGLPDPSEYPAAYKEASHVRGIIEKDKLAYIADEIIPYGSIMAGDWETNSPWRTKK